MFWAWEVTARYAMGKSMNKFTLAVPMFNSSFNLNTMTFSSIKYDKVSHRIIIEGEFNDVPLQRNMLSENIDNGSTRTKANG
jgi:hypothetical protein